MDAVIDITKSQIGFAAAHFVIVDGDAEPLHGHNFAVHARAAGSVGSDGLVLDFGVIKTAMRRLCAFLDHRTLLPMGSPAIRVVEAEGAVEVAAGGRRYLLPSADVRLLPIVATSCECLAAHLLRSLHELLGPADLRLAVRVEDSPGQGCTVSD